MFLPLFDLYQHLLGLTDQTTSMQWKLFLQPYSTLATHDMQRSFKSEGNARSPAGASAAWPCGAFSTSPWQGDLPSKGIALTQFMTVGGQQGRVPPGPRFPINQTNLVPHVSTAPTRSVTENFQFSYCPLA